MRTLSIKSRACSPSPCTSRQKTPGYSNRDHAGIKPLFYSLKTEHSFLPVKSTVGASRSVQHAEFRSHLPLFYVQNVPSPSTAFKDIQQLRPGEMIRYQNNTLHKTFGRIQPTTTNLDDHEAAQQLHALLKRSVLQQAKADVEVVPFVRRHRQLSSSRPVCPTTSLSHKNVYAHLWKRACVKVLGPTKRIAGFKALQYRSSRANANGKGFWADVEDIVLPLTSCFPALTPRSLSRLIAKHVKVALSGDGADELLGAIYRTASLSRFMTMPTLPCWRDKAGST